MTYNDVIFGSVPVNEIELNQNELRARLGRQEINDEIIACIEKTKSVLTPRFAYAVVNCDTYGESVDFSFAKVDSSSLYEVLKTSKKAVLLAVSIGNEIDRLISRAGYTDKTEAFYIDAIGSAYVESLADRVQDLLKQKYALTNRFSPGYADFPLEFQKELLGRLASNSTVGISLTDKLLMVPMKSITAVIGINDERSSK
ncbi:MAG: vitamin B12 dependent-methionine synthase activation domain-containing protein [Eubacteriales bacterium]